MSDWNLPPGVTAQMIEDAQGGYEMCIWEDCDQEARFCPGHAAEYMLPDIESLKQKLARLAEALNAALETYHEQWKHPGTDKMPHKLPDPKWVVEARAALALLDEKACTPSPSDAPA